MEASAPSTPARPGVTLTEKRGVPTGPDGVRELDGRHVRSQTNVVFVYDPGGRRHRTAPPNDAPNADSIDAVARPNGTPRRPVGSGRGARDCYGVVSIRSSAPARS
jgi:hypothetical protein